MKKTVFLFNSPIIKENVDKLEMGNVFPRIGIASVAAYLRSNGVKVKVFDPSNEPEEKTARVIEEFNPDIVGIPSFTPEIFDANETAGLVKKINPNILTVVGGSHSSALPQRTLEEFPFFDIAVFGEGEKTILDLALNKPLSKIPGLCYKTGKKIKTTPPRCLIDNLDDLPFPAWDLFDLDMYRGGSLATGFKKSGGELEIPIEGARGCPFNCNFCFRVNGKTIRFKSPKRIVEEIEIAIEKFGATSIFFVEGTFAVDKEKTKKLCELIMKRRLNKKITWSTGGRVNVLDEQLLKLMKESGCNFLGYGVESGDQEMLDKMGKQITIKQIIDSFDLCKRIGIMTEANFIIGHPYETEARVLKTIEFARNLKTNYANFAIMVPFPGTQVYEMARKKIGGLRLLTENWRLYGKQIGSALESKFLTHKKLLELQTKAYFRFYFTVRRFPLFIKRLTIARLKEAIKRLAGWY